MEWNRKSEKNSNISGGTCIKTFCEDSFGGTLSV